MITGIAHINLTIPPGTLEDADCFYGETLGLHRIFVPALQRDTLAWYDITPQGQQVHIAVKDEVNDQTASRHPCFKVENEDALKVLQERIWECHQKGDKGCAREIDRPGGENSGSKGVEYPTRFFARDFAGNRLEFSL